MTAVFAADWVKMRRSRIWVLPVLVPGGVLGLALLILWYFAKTDAGVSRGWMIALDLLHHILAPVIFLSVSLFSAWLAQMEHQSGMWKQWLTMPIAKWQLYTAKFLWTAGFAQLCGVLLTGGMYGIGRLWSVEQSASFSELLIYAYFPFFLAIPLAALHNWLSLVYENPAVSISVGVAGVILGPLFKYWAWWTPWGFLTTYMPAVGAVPQASVWGMSLVVGAVWGGIGWAHFIRKDWDGAGGN